MMALLIFAAATTIPPDFDLALLPKRAGQCRNANADQILVCASGIVRDDRVRDFGSADELYLPKAEVTLVGDVKAAVESEAVDIGGSPSKRMMVRVKIPF